MDQNTKDTIKHIIISALIGAAVTFLTQILGALTSAHIGGAQSVIGGSASALTYLKLKLPLA